MSDLFTLHHVSLYVRDVDASASFYANVLGLQEIPNRVGKDHIRWFTINGFRTFHLIGGDPEPERPRSFSHTCGACDQRLRGGAGSPGAVRGDVR